MNIILLVACERKFMGDLVTYSRNVPFPSSLGFLDESLGMSIPNITLS